MKKVKFAVMAICMIAMLAIPINTIVRWNMARAYGVEYKFKCRLYDPMDLLRGRYVALAFENDNIVKMAEPVENYRDVKKVYATIIVRDGFAVLDRAYTKPPASGIFIEVNKLYWLDSNNSENPNTIAVEVPFNRYYMNEKKAPFADEMLRNSLLDKKDIYLTVKIYNGDVAPTGLFIDGKPIEKVVADKMSST